MFWVGLPHSSEVPPNKSPKSQCHTQHLIPCSLPSGDPFASREIDSKMFKALYTAVGQTWVVLGWYLKHIETESKHGMISDLES